MRAAHARLMCRHGEKLLDQCRIERGAQADGLGEVRGVAGGLAVQAFLVKDYRDAKTRVFEEELLDSVGQFGHTAGSLALPRFARRCPGIAGPPDLAEAMAGLESRPGLAGIEIALRVHKLLCLLLPDAHHLRRLFLERHARKEVSNTKGDRNVRLLVKRRGFTP